ncbi:hypothetical protein DPMN_006154 [Dreissena polymorpha]|uniref:Uncharacterized protein n=1 Tax=Dreissena polymorpha TaxID=45954 RepID=A0A9D4MUS0_DREPO|nr:hypothetical protein DPMN_006154 [Dreissena polymorpha]
MTDDMQNRWTLSAPVTSSAAVRCRISQDGPIIQVHNTQTRLRCTSKEMLLISRKCRHRLQPAQPTQLILFEKHCQWDSG